MVRNLQPLNEFFCSNFFLFRTESSGSGKNRSTRVYSAKETYLNTTVIFANKPPNGDLYLEVGEYAYPFQIVLPSNLPTSFEHTYGKVRYSIYGTIDIPWAIDKHTIRSFTVISHLNLNANPAYAQAYGVSDIKSMYI